DSAISTLVAPFNSVKQAIETVPDILRRGILPTAVEFVQHEVISCAEKLLKKSWPTHDGSASLVFILDGRSEDDLLDQAEKLAELLESGGALDVLIAESPERQEEILTLRSMIYEALREGTVELFDICVPRSEIAGHVEFVKEVEERYKIQLPTYGHAGDGNVHTHYMRKAISNGLLDAEVTGWRQLHEKVREELFADAAARGGVISGEHGIGRVKREYLEKNLGAVNVEVMRLIKRALDSDNILNPGKVVQ
ncbi:MAG: FAD-binding oxidoreductase, partial [Spirochaeta sp.]|nr:FAD-binding oxidoreductase [Spirochaeta sp.]